MKPSVVLEFEQRVEVLDVALDRDAQHAGLRPGVASAGRSSFETFAACRQRAASAASASNSGEICVESRTS